MICYPPHDTRDGTKGGTRKQEAGGTKGGTKKNGPFLRKEERPEKRNEI